MNKNSGIVLIVTCLDIMYTLLLLQEIVLDGWRRLWSSIQGWEGEHEWVKPHHISRWHRAARSYYHRSKHEASLFQCSIPKFCKFCFVILCILGAICCFMASLYEMNTQEWNLSFCPQVSFLKLLERFQWHLVLIVNECINDCFIRAITIYTLKCQNLMLWLLSLLFV